MELGWLCNWLSLMELGWLSVSTVVPSSLDLAETALRGCGRSHGGIVSSALEWISKLGIKQAIGIS